MPDKQHPQEEFWVGAKWTPGARKVVFWVVVAVCGGGVGLVINQLPQWLSIAPVAAFVAVLGITYFTSLDAADAARWSPEVALSSVSTTYADTRGFFQC